MTETAGSVVRGGAVAARGGVAGLLGGFPTTLREALETEIEHRRLFLWFPVAMGAGVALYYAADREPNLPLIVGVAIVLALLAALARHHRRPFVVIVGAAAIA